jgi:sodium/potassium-transporting ATPase subunit alpha
MCSGAVVHPSPAFEPHCCTETELYARLASSPVGLASHEAEERLRHEGPNVLPPARREPTWRRLAKHLTHRFALLLWAGSGLAFVGERFSPGEGMALISVALVVVVLLNAAFTIWQEQRVEQAMAAFRQLLSHRAHVLRDGVERDVEAATLVVGDAIVLREGVRVPADARVVEAHMLKVDNSLLTGECEPQLRTTSPMYGGRLESRNLVFSGTLVTTGTGRALVYAVAGATELGRVAQQTQAITRVQTPIHRELQHFIRVITGIALSLGALFFVVGLVIGNPFWTNLVFAIGIIVANVPEGLLPTVTLALAIAGRRMAKRSALLKTLESAETLGSTTTICTDKTGTLTLDQMRVAELRVQDQAAQEDARRVMALCNNAVVHTDVGRPDVTGDPTEVALLLHVEEQDPGGVARRRAACPRAFERPFDSATREMATVHRVDGRLQALLKGAPEVVVDQCELVRRGDALVSLSPEERARVREQADQLARSGKRVLALACKPVDGEGQWDDAELEAEVLGAGYELVALVAMRDPPRPEVPAAVARCREAGIRIIVISGDHPLTVEAIAREVGIVGDGAAVITGAQLEGLGPAALRHAVQDEGVLFARTSPLDKLRIVTALQEAGHVVAVTGDGVNDAPALKRADIGVAMGRTGTDVAREAAHMVLMNDDFTTIVAAVEEGRVLYGNIRRFIGYVLTSNVPEILPYIAFVLLGIPLPLPVLLILAIDLGTDMLPAVGLATEPAETDVMRQPPRPRSERLLSRRLLFEGYVRWGLFESVAGFSAYAAVLWAGGWRWGQPLGVEDALYGQAIAAYFGAVIVCQVPNAMIWRTTRQSVFTKGLLRNRAVVAGVVVELLALWWIVETDTGQAVFGTVGLPWWGWLVPVPFALGMLVWAELRKWRARRRA